MSTENNTHSPQVKKLALEIHGWKEAADLRYWGNAADDEKVKATAAILAREFAAKDAEIATLREDRDFWDKKAGEQHVRAEKAEAEHYKSEAKLRCADDVFTQHNFLAGKNHGDELVANVLKLFAERDQLRQEAQGLREEAAGLVKRINEADAALEDAGIKTEETLRQIPTAEGINNLRAQLAASQDYSKRLKDNLSHCRAQFLLCGFKASSRLIQKIDADIDQASARSEGGQ